MRLKTDYIIIRDMVQKGYRHTKDILQTGYRIRLGLGKSGTDAMIDIERTHT